MQATDAIAAREHAIAWLREHLSEDDLIYTQTTYGRGETDWVRIFIVRDGREIEDITYYVAQAAGKPRLKPNAGWAFGGAQYNKGLEAADWAWRQAFGKPIDQHYWRELH